MNISPQLFDYTITFVYNIQESFNTIISHPLFDYTINLENSQH